MQNNNCEANITCLENKLNIRMKTGFNWLAPVSGSFQQVQKAMSVTEICKCVAVPMFDTRAHLDGCEWSASRSGRFTLPGTEFRIVKPTV